MPNLNEFIKNKDNVPLNLEKINEPRPCFHCSKDADFYYWNASSMEMTWECPDGHKNLYRIN